jgi:hypothetical protein
MTTFKKSFFIIYSLLSLPILALSATMPSHYEAGFGFANGAFSNSAGDTPKSTNSILAPDLSFNYYLTPTQAITSGLDLHLSFSQSQVGLLGLRVGYKWYYWGQGNYETSKSDFMEADTRQRISAYFGSNIKRYSYFLSNSYDSDKKYESSGSYFNLDLLFGADYLISHQYKVTAIASITALALVVTDDRVKISSKMLSFGISYLF